MPAVTERRNAVCVQDAMMREAGKFAVFFAVTFMMTGVIACSASEEQAPGEDVTAALKDVPEGVVNRFILVVETGKDGKASAENIASVQAALREGGAEEVETLEGSPIVFATCEPAAIYKAAETGLLSSVQVDRLSKTQQPARD